MFTLSTYLVLDGNCAAAMRFYQECLGGELAMTTVGDSPMKAMVPESMHGRVINARLVGGAADISASDWMRPGEKRVQGNSVCLYLSGGTTDETRAVFEKLSRGASVTDPIAEQPFGLYGALNDAFGVRWMFHAETTAAR
jgi:PhnB protein